MITFNQWIQPTFNDESPKRLFHLKNDKQSILIMCDRMPSIIYWGKRLRDLNSSVIAVELKDNETISKEQQALLNLLQALSRPVAQGGLDDYIPLTLCPEASTGLYTSPGIEGHRSGQAWAPMFQPVSADYVESDHTEKLVCQLVDEHAQLALEITLTFYTQSGVLQKDIAVTNIGCDNYQVNKLANTLPIFEEPSQLTSFHGRWCQEMQKMVQPITRKSLLQENRRGKTSLEYFPGVIISKCEATELSGDVIGFHLAWSGNHQFMVHVETDNKRFLQANELLMPGEIILSAGMRYQAPSLYATLSSDGFNGMSHNFHHFVRSQLVKFADNTPVRPVHLNTWEGIYFDHNPTYLLQMAHKAAELGIERFIIDDGWFIGRKDDKRALGDWFVDKHKYPDGLTPIIQAVNSLGMQFGIWVEPEMISLDSELYKKHPEWLLGLDGYKQPSGRYQFVLNLQIEACFNYVFERLDALLTEYNINYLKWDMNRDLVQPAHLGVAAISKQTQQVYRLIDKLRQAHPSIEIESCASGGGRIDFEILKRTQRFWASDCNDALERQTIQRHLSYFFPPEILGTHIGAAISHSTFRQHSLNFRAVTAMFGHMGIEFDPLKSSDEEISQLKHYLSLHKQYRSLLHTGKCYRLDSIDPAQVIHAVSDSDHCIVSIAQIAMPSFSLPPMLKLAFLEPVNNYRIECIELPTNCGHLMKKWPQWLMPSILEKDDNQIALSINTNVKPMILSGELLASIGIALPILDPETAMLLKFTKQPVLS